MSERKVLSKYYPPDFDPSALGRQRKPKDAAPKAQTVRLMAPFSMKCMTCGEYIYKGRKFNARKETTDERYYNIPIYRFYIRCTRCSAELTFKTDPKHMDYECEKGAKRNFEPWRENQLAEETEEERLDRLEREEGERDAMAEVEAKALDAKTEMAIADSLDLIRTRNARLERSDGNAKAADTVADELDEVRRKQDEEDAAAAQKVFQAATGEKIRRLQEDDETTTTERQDVHTSPAMLNDGLALSTSSHSPPVSFVRTARKKKDFAAALGIKKKAV